MAKTKAVVAAILGVLGCAIGIAILVSGSDAKIEGWPPSQGVSRAPSSTGQFLISPQSKKYLEQHGDNFLSAAYEPSLTALRDCPGDFFRLDERFDIPGELEAVFNAFLSRSPRDAWRRPAEFDLLIVPSPEEGTSTAYDRTATRYPIYASGQIYLLNLRILPSFKIPVAFKIVEFDRARHRLAFSYVRSNASQGIQDIEFRQIGDHVEVTHQTCYRSSSELRDRIYPVFHRELVSHFYGAFEESLRSSEN